MREHIDTVPLIEAFDAGDECPFCYLERMAEQKTIRYVLGPSASYMEPDVRGQTDGRGFCREHMQKMYTYGNALGNALILQTHMAGLLEQLHREVDALEVPDKRPLLGKNRTQDLPILQWARERGSGCFLCDRLHYHMDRYYTTYFVLLKDPQFREKAENGKGLCLRHFAQLLEQARDKLPNGQRQWFYETVPAQLEANLLRVKEDLDHFVGMFDYRSAGGDWKNARDAVSRSMQKLRGLYPADPPYREK